MRFVWTTVMLVVIEAPLASVFTTSYLGKAVFLQAPADPRRGARGPPVLAAGCLVPLAAARRVAGAGCSCSLWIATASIRSRRLFLVLLAWRSSCGERRRRF